MDRLNNARFLIALLVGVSAFAIAPRTEAQTVTGTIVGTVLDAQGAVIPNASISARNRETDLERTATSDGSGEFTVTSVPAGPYDVTVTAPGFQQTVRSGITMTVGATLRVDFKLNVGDVQQKVVVTSEAPQIDTTTSELSGLVNDTSIRQLPLNGRDWLQLTALQAGVLLGLTKNPDQGENVTHGAGVFLTVSGGRPTSNVFMVDGLVINNEANKSPGGSVHGINMGVDALKEFSVLTSTFPAEYGRSSGGVVNAVTQSGTNNIHGTGFGFIRNSALDSSNFFTGKQFFYRGQFGAAIGGPIKKDKLFWFGDYEGIREFKAESAPTFTISDAARSGTLPGQAPIPAAVRPYLALFPAANGPVVPGTNGYVAQLFFPGGNRGTENYGIGRIDYVPSAKSTIHGTYMFDDSSTTAPDSVGLKTIGDTTRDQRLTLSWQYSLTPTILNTVNTGFTRETATGNIDVVGSGTVPIESDPSAGFYPNQNLGVITIGDLAPGTPGTGSTVPGGVGSTGGDSVVWTDPQVNDNIGWVKGRNDIRFGFSVEAIQSNLSVGRFPLGDWEFNTTQDFLANTNPTTFQATVPGVGAGAYRSTREKIFGMYIQDNIRVLSNLTINVGLRYEPTTTYNVLNGLAANFQSLTDPTITTGNPIFHNPTHRDVNPRVGLAWDPTGSGKTAVRAAFGMFNVLPLPNLLSGNLNHAIPFFDLVNINNPAATFPLAPPGNTLAAQATGYFMDPNPREAYKLQWNLDVQRQVTNSLSVTVAYVGARGVHLPFRYGDINIVPPSLVTTAPDGHLLFPAVPKGGSPVVINPNQKLTIPATLWNVDSFYHALQINVVQRISHGLSFQAAYAYSRGIDDGSSEVNNSDNANTADNPYAFVTRLNKGPSDWDVPQHLSLNFDWLAPSLQMGMVVPRFLLSGWELGGIYTVQSGMPFSVQLSKFDLANTGFHGQAAERPNFVDGPGCTPGAVNPGSVFNYVNGNCFAAPPAGELGNSGRNSLRGPGFNNLDFSIFKNHTVKERLKVQFRAEFFNIFNWTNFEAGTQRIFSGKKTQTINQTGLSLLQQTAGDEREIQFGLKFIY